MEHKPKRRVGRPAKLEREAKQKARRFYPLEKNDTSIALMNAAHAAYVRQHGHDATDAEILRDALRQYGTS